MVMFDDPRDPERLPRDRPDRPGGAPAPAPAPAPSPLPPASAPPPVPPNRVRPPSDSGATTIPSDVIGDIPPPPIPPPPPPSIGMPGMVGIPGGGAGVPGAGAEMFARPMSAGAAPFRTSGYAAPRQQRFGPGAPVVGGAGMSGFGAGEGGMGMGLEPDDVAELLRALAAGRGPASVS